MLKWIQVIILMLITVQITSGAVIIEWSPDNESWQNVTSIDEKTGIAYQPNLEEGKLYYFRSKNDTTEFIYTSARTLTSGERPMSSLSITFFVMFITLSFLLMPIKLKSITRYDYLNRVLQGGSLVIGLLLLSLVAAMMATLSSTFELGLTNEIFRFMWIIQWAAYISIVIVVLGFGYSALKMWKFKKYNQRMGTEDEPGYN